MLPPSSATSRSPPRETHDVVDAGELLNRIGAGLVEDAQRCAPDVVVPDAVVALRREVDVPATLRDAFATGERRRYRHLMPGRRRRRRIRRGNWQPADRAVRRRPRRPREHRRRDPAIGSDGSGRSGRRLTSSVRYKVRRRRSTATASWRNVPSRRPHDRPALRPSDRTPRRGRDRTLRTSATCPTASPRRRS